MNLAQPKTAFSFDAFLEWERTEQEKHEFLRGEVFAMTGVSTEHSICAGNLFAAMHAHLRGRACQLHMADMKVRTEVTDGCFYPDIMVTCDARDRLDEARYVKRHPMLVIEVLSPSTEACDRGEKFSSYRSLTSLQEYVLVSPRLQTVEVFRRDTTGHWVLSPFAEAEGTFVFASIGFTGRFDSLFEGLETIEDSVGAAPAEGAGT